MQRKQPFKLNNSDGSYWIYGFHSTISCLNNPLRKIYQIVADKKYAKDLETYNFKKNFLSSAEIENLFPDSLAHQNIGVRVSAIQKDLDFSREQISLLILDHIKDVHNIGAIIRSAAAFGFDAIISTEHNSPDESSIIAKIASGALEVIPYIKVVNLSQYIEDLKKRGFWIYGLDGSAKTSVNNIKFDQKTALIMGSEAKGMRRLIRENCDMLIKINTTTNVESLNVSVAAAIVMEKLYSQK